MNLGTPTFMDSAFVSLVLVPIGAFAIVLVVWLADGLRYLYDYRVTEQGIQFLVLRVIPWRCIPFSNIAEIRRTGSTEFILTAMNLKNRRAQMIRPVLVTKKRSWFSRKFLLTPEDPDSFISAVQSRIQPAKQS